MIKQKKLIEILKNNQDSIERGDWNAVYDAIGANYTRGQFSTFLLENEIDPSTMFKTEIPELAFADCSSLTSITIPNSIKEIGGGAFMSCSRLAAVNIPDSVKKIGDNAFYSCQSLTSITIPNSVKEIGDDAFGGGYLLVKFDGTQEEWLDIKFKDDWHQGGADNIVFLK